MASERAQKQTVYGDSLDSFISTIAGTFKTQMDSRNADLETKFNQLVLEGNLSLADQLDYRKNQLSQVVDDPAEKSRIQGEVSNLTDRIEQQKFTDAYTDKVTAYASGAESIDNLLSWLNDTKASTTDQTILNNINNDIATYTDRKNTLTTQMLKDQTDFALNDKTADVINSQITTVSSAKTKALLAGDGTTAASLDLQLQSLKQALTANSIEKDVKNMAIATVSGFSSATSLLDAYNGKISSADTTSPVTVNGVTYANAQEFWTYSRDSYVADQSNSGFFSRLDTELTDSVKVKNSNNTLSSSDISDATAQYNSLYARPELANFTAKIDVAKQDTLQTAANYLVDQITNKFDNTYDLNGAITSLNALKAQGVNVDAGFQKVITSAAGLQSTAVSQIVQTAQDMLNPNSANYVPGLSIGDAVTKASATGAGAIIAPNTLNSSTPTDTAKTVITGGSKSAITPSTDTTIKPENQNPTTTPTTPVPGTPTPAPATPGATPAGGSYTIVAGDTLSAIAAKHNTTVAALASANNIADPNKIQAGATIKIPTTATPAPVVTNNNPPIVAPKASTTPQPTPQSTAPVAAPKAPETQPANPTPSGSQGYSFNKTSSGSVEIYQNGQRISTGSADYAKSLGYAG